MRQLATEIVTLPVIRLFFLPHFMVGVVGLIFDEDKRLLLLEHTYRGQYPWGLPTGFLEHREQPDAALEREIREETGFSVALLPGPTIFVSTTHPIVSILYRGTCTGGTFVPGPEIASARFFSASELPRVSPEQRALLRDVEQEILP